MFCNYIVSLREHTRTNLKPTVLGSETQAIYVFGFGGIWEF